MKNRMPKFVRLLLTAALLAAVALISLYSIYRIWEKPPEKNETPLEAKAMSPIGEEGSPEPTGAYAAMALEDVV